MDYNQLALQMHEQNRGKIAVQPKVRVANRDDLSTAYTPGVAEPCRRIAANRDDVYRYTAKGNLVAVVSDGTAVLGLGDIGPEAAMPVMEGKALLFKEFADVDAFPICLDTKDVEEIIRTVKYLAPTFGGINLEDISAPRCFEIEKRLKEELDIPVFHDDQHGTAIVVCAGLLNALKLVGKEMEHVNIVINGAGSAGISIAKLLMQFGAGNIVLVDKNGAVSVDEDWLNPAQRQMAEVTNKRNERGPLAEVIRDKDVFIGVSARRSSRRRWSLPWRRTPSCSPWPTPPRRSCPKRRQRAVRGSLPPAAATTPTRSTTCWCSPASSGARWAQGLPTSPRK